jgi:hypothetical protein
MIENQQVGQALMTGKIDAQVIMNLERSLRSGVDWFFWIAGFSLINSIAFRMGASISFVVGLGATQMIDGVFQELTREFGGNLFLILGFVMNLAVAAIFVAAGFLGRKRHRWAVIFGLLLYGFDTLILLAFQVWWGALFHVYALYFLVRGLIALNKIKKLETSVQPSFV